MFSTAPVLAVVTLLGGAVAVMATVLFVLFLAFRLQKGATVYFVLRLIMPPEEVEKFTAGRDDGELDDGWRSYTFSVFLVDITAYAVQGVILLVRHRPALFGLAAATPLVALAYESVRSLAEGLPFCTFAPATGMVLALAFASKRLALASATVTALATAFARGFSQSWYAYVPSDLIMIMVTMLIARRLRFTSDVGFGPFVARFVVSCTFANIVGAVGSLLTDTAMNFVGEGYILLDPGEYLARSFTATEWSVVTLGLAAVALLRVTGWAKQLTGPSDLELDAVSER